MRGLFNRVLNVFGRRSPMEERMCVEDKEMNRENFAMNKNEAEASEMQTPTLDVNFEVEHHGKDKNLSLLLKAASEFDGTEEQWNDFLLQKSPMGNTVLHIAAMHKKNELVDEVVRKAPHLITEKNDNGDTPLHVAAKDGHISTIKKMLQVLPLSYTENPKRALYEILARNKQGNTLFHEAFLNGHKDVLRILDETRFEDGFKELVERAALFWTNKKEKSILHLAIEKGYKEIVNHALTKLTSQHPALDELIQSHHELAQMIQKESNHVAEQDQGREIENQQHNVEWIPYGPHYVPPGKSLLILSILKQHQDILTIILRKKKEWIHLRDDEGRSPLHYAASIGYLKGVEQLLGKCISCNMERDNDGYFPLHSASAEGHLKVAKKLLEYCPDPREMVDNYGRNILHLAIEGGQLKMVKYILQQSTDNHELEKMINDKDFNGNTPLHVAVLCCHPKIVYELTCDPRVDLTLTNDEGQTAHDVCIPHWWRLIGRLTPRQTLTEGALVSAGAKLSRIEVPTRPQNTKNYWQEEAPKTDQFKERTNSLILVAALIVTVTFAAGFTLPGGINTDSNKEKGMALMLHNILFNLFMISNTASMYGAIGVILLLIWAQLGDLTLFLLSYNLAMPLLGFTLATLSLAFLTGVELVISHLTWLATFIAVMSFMFMLLFLFIYALLFMPMARSTPVLKYIARRSMLFEMWLFVDSEEAISRAISRSKPSNS